MSLIALSKYIHNDDTEITVNFFGGSYKKDMIDDVLYSMTGTGNDVTSEYTKKRSLEVVRSNGRVTDIEVRETHVLQVDDRVYEMLMRTNGMSGQEIATARIGGKMAPVGYSDGKVRFYVKSI